MSIFSRMTDIINSNLNALLDRAEDPEKMIRLIIQEMEDTLVEVRSSSARVIADRKQAARRLEQVRAEAANWEEKARLAISKGREDLARAALQEKRELEEDVCAVEEEWAVVRVMRVLLRKPRANRIRSGQPRCGAGARCERREPGAPRARDRRPDERLAIGSGRR